MAGTFVSNEHRDRRARLISASLCALVWGLAAIPIWLFWRIDTLAERQRINVRYVQGTPDPARADIEARFALREGERQPGAEGDRERRTWSYRLADQSTTNIAALVMESHIEDTAGVDRRTFQLELDTSQLPSWGRSLVKSGRLEIAIAALLLLAAVQTWRSRRVLIAAAKASRRMLTAVATAWRRGVAASVDSLSRPLDRRRITLNAALALLAVLVFAASRQVSGEVTLNGHLGWDGGEYALALQGRWAMASPNIALRPLLVFANRPAFWLLADPVAAFRFMNGVYIGMLFFVVCALFDAYNRSTFAKVLLVGNLCLCIVIVKYAAYYPVLVDTGAYLVIAAAVLSIVKGNRVAIAPLAAAAVLSREFGAAVTLLGVARDLRNRTPLRTIVATYALPALSFVVVRLFVARYAHGAPLSAGALFGNLRYWLDPVFVWFFVYFVLTVFGGITLFVLSSPSAVIRHWRREWEWLAYSLSIIAAAAMGDADIWRYLAYLLPAIVVAFATSWDCATSPRWRWGVGGLVTSATMITQRPWQHITLNAYFLDWFPYYVRKGTAVLESPVSLWPLWQWRFVTAAALLSVFVLLRGRVLTPKSELQSGVALPGRALP